jgi:hypothetical protein
MIAGPAADTATPGTLCLFRSDAMRRVWVELPLASVSDLSDDQPDDVGDGRDEPPEEVEEGFCQGFHALIVDRRA